MECQNRVRIQVKYRDEQNDKNLLCKKALVEVCIQTLFSEVESSH